MHITDSIIGDSAIGRGSRRMICLPIELVDSIVHWLLATGRSFSSISAFSLVSHRYRQIALRRYYGILHVQSVRHWFRMCHIKGMSDWVRSLGASTTVFRHKVDFLAHFTSLKTLELDFSDDGLSTQTSRATLLFRNMTAQLKTLKLTHLPCIDLALLSLISTRFPTLVTLELSCTERLDERCCWHCLEESSTCCVHSPIPEAYATTDILIVKVCKALRPLEKLETLLLGIFLSDADVLVRHLERCAAIIIPSPRTGYYSAPPFGPDKCAICHAEHGPAVRERERLASDMLRQLLPSVKAVEFSSWFAVEAPMRVLDASR
ncbi:hypothetical protein PYCCODRAFT_1450858 [Trametes coccinea BRFM310]|uniref:F-box domain-containing protein n=1 Tax=Trametes coccinea (strain BRFM310) TaxID=1353009 RepID=A0A1Y2IY09_TRAC3|nr:hypothetical protein PYCCODRAFT_1450858 [Trametes coccinea BRFM310]